MALKKLDADGNEIAYLKVTGNYSSHGIELLAYENHEHRLSGSVNYHPAVPITFSCSQDVEILLGKITPKVTAGTVLEVKKAALYDLINSEIAKIVDLATHAGTITVIDTEKFNCLKTGYKEIFFNELVSDE